MALVLIGVLLLLMKWADFGPVADWGWPWVLAPFGLAALWWAIADSTGLTQRRAIEKMEARKAARRERDMKALGLDIRSDRRIRVLRDPAARRRGEEPPPAPPPSGSPPDERQDPRP